MHSDLNVFLKKKGISFIISVIWSSVICSAGSLGYSSCSVLHVKNYFSIIGATEQAHTWFTGDRKCGDLPLQHSCNNNNPNNEHILCLQLRKVWTCSFFGKDNIFPLSNLTFKSNILGYLSHTNFQIHRLKLVLQ